MLFGVGLTLYCPERCAGGRKSYEDQKLPEESRWESVPESTGTQAPTVPAADEQTFAERLVEEGVEDAEHEQMIEATRQSLRRERSR